MNAVQSEPCSQPRKDIFTKIVRSLKDDDISLKAVMRPSSNLMMFHLP